MTLKPTTDHVVVKEKVIKEQTESGLLLTTTEQTKTQVFTIVAIGDGKLSDNQVADMSPIKIGDTVILDHYYNKFIPIDGENYLIVRIGDIIGIVEE